MSFHYAQEKRKFDQEWAKLRQEYKQAGMSEEAIQLLYEYDLEWFRSRRSYDSHTQHFPFESYIDEAGSALPRKYPALVTYIPGSDFSSAEGDMSWLSEISGRPNLLCRIKELSASDQLLLSLFVEGLNQTQIAERTGYTQSGVSKRLRKIKGFLKGSDQK